MKFVLALLCLPLTALAAAHSPPDRSEAIYEAYESQLERRMDQHFHDGEFLECLSILWIMQGISPDDPFVSGLITYMLGNVGKDDEALKVALRFRRAHLLDPVAADNLATIYFGLKLYSRIPAVLEPIIEISPGIRNFVMLARAYEELGLLRECLRIWEMRYARNPEDRTAEARIKRLKERLGG